MHQSVDAESVKLWHSKSTFPHCIVSYNETTLTIPLEEIHKHAKCVVFSLESMWDLETNKTTGLAMKAHLAMLAVYGSIFRQDQLSIAKDYID